MISLLVPNPREGLPHTVFRGIIFSNKGTLTMNVRNTLNQWQNGGLKRHRLNQIPLILHRMNQNKLSRGDLVKVIKVRYQVAHFFEPMLEHMLLVIRSGRFWRKDGMLWPDVQAALEQAVFANLQEERGEAAGYGGPHRNARAVFLESLGVDYAKWVKPLCTYDQLKGLDNEQSGGLDEAANYVVTQLQHIIEYGAVEAVSILWCYERAISRDGNCGDYCILLRAFEHAFPEFAKPDHAYREGEPLWHLASHATHDEQHAETAAEALATLDGKRGCWTQSLDLGVRTAFITNLNFWNELSRRFCGAWDSREHWCREELVLA